LRGEEVVWYAERRENVCFRTAVKECLDIGFDPKPAGGVGAPNMGHGGKKRNGKVEGL
jgi:hypothetical protein